MKAVRRTALRALALLAFLSLALHSPAASIPGGGIIVRVPDGQGATCVAIPNHWVSLHLRRAIVSKDIGWFTQDREIGLLVSTVMEGFEGSQLRKVTFPRMLQVNVKEFGKGRVSLPVEMKVFSSFQLMQGTTSFDSVDLKFAVLKKKSKAPFGAALSALADITKRLPAPMNPFSEGFKFFAEYASTAVESSINEQNNVSDQAAAANFALAFSSDSNCSGDEESTGTFAAVYGATGLESDGIVNISTEAAYCWNALLKPTFTLQFVGKPSDGDCTKVSTAAWITLRNPYFAFVLNAFEPPQPAAPDRNSPLAPLLEALGARARSSLDEAKARCIANGIPREECFGDIGLQ